MFINYSMYLDDAEPVFLKFNQLLAAADIDPAQVRLLRHQPILDTKRYLIDIWTSAPDQFEEYQSVQLRNKRVHFNNPYWASFIGTPDGKTAFIGLYKAELLAPFKEDYTDSLTGQSHSRDTVDRYQLISEGSFDKLAGRLFIDWGGGSSGKRAWVQRADFQNKSITVLHQNLYERPFPGFIHFYTQLDQLSALPPSWTNQLRSARGVYLLTCPDTGSQYVGSATGHAGFLGRWRDYQSSGHGGNLGLKAVETSKFQVSILHVASTAETSDDIIAMEEIWKSRLMSRQFGYNQN